MLCCFWPGCFKMKYENDKQDCDQRGLKGVITVELSYLLPMILMIFLMVVYVTFYYHDKNILIGAASETAVVGAQLERKPDENGKTDLSGFYQERIRGKLILFSGAQASVNITRKWVEVSAYAERGKMRLNVVQRAPLADPETAIRRLWMLEKAVDAAKEAKSGGAGDTDDSEDNTVKIEDGNSNQKQIGQKGAGTAAESR